MKKQFITVKKTIKPYRAIWRSMNRGGVLDIGIVPDEYMIKEYVIEVHDTKVAGVKITKGKHPNCHPKTKEYCIPRRFVGCPASRVLQDMLEFELSIYYLAHSYFPMRDSGIEWILSDLVQTWDDVDIDGRPLQGRSMTQEEIHEHRRDSREGITRAY